MHALARFSHIAAQNTFTTAEIYSNTLSALEVPPTHNTAWVLFDTTCPSFAPKDSLRVPRSRRYRLLREGYSICLLFLRLFERIYAPLTAGLLQPFSGDTRLQQQKRCRSRQAHGCGRLKAS